MAEEIAEKCSNLRIQEDEEEIVNLESIEGVEENSCLKLSIEGKVLTERSYNFEAFKKTMNHIWAISKGALFRQIENGLFVVQFAHNKDRTKVLDGRLWTFDQHLVMLDEVKGNQQPSDISHPLGDVRTIAGKFGEVIEVERDGVVWDKSVRARVILNIMKPLRRFVRIRNKEGNIVSIEVKYERLPTFCYACGEIGHIERDCEKVAEEDKDSDKQWGS
ncbi:Proline--tRNA ligase [Bienertia sinuspersici]